MRDWHILTSGLLTYTADARFRVKHQSQPLIQPPPTMSSSSSSSSAAAAAAASIVPSRPDVSEWTLEIKFLQARDEGTYYCQVFIDCCVPRPLHQSIAYFSRSYCTQIPTRTGTMVHAFHLYVASPQAVILGGQVSHVDILTPSLTLVCIVDNVSAAVASPCDCDCDDSHPDQLVRTAAHPLRHLNSIFSSSFSSFNQQSCCCCCCVAASVLLTTSARRLILTTSLVVV